MIDRQTTISITFCASNSGYEAVITASEKDNSFTELRHINSDTFAGVISNITSLVASLKSRRSQEPPKMNWKTEKGGKTYSGYADYQCPDTEWGFDGECYVEEKRQAFIKDNIQRQKKMYQGYEADEVLDTEWGFPGLDYRESKLKLYRDWYIIKTLYSALYSKLEALRAKREAERAKREAERRQKVEKTPIHTKQKSLWG